MTIINTTVYGNQANTCGGAFYYHKGRTGSELNLVNCTFIYNTVVTDNVGLGPGFRFEANSGESPITTRNVVKRIYNTIIENNHIAGKPASVMDMSFRAHTPENGLDMFLHNSFVGRTLTKATYSVVQPLKGVKSIA